MKLEEELLHLSNNTNLEVGSKPCKVTSKRNVVYRQSGWKVHQFEVWSGSLVCRASALRTNGGLFLWVGGEGSVRLGNLAAGVPMSQDGREALSTTLMAGGEGHAASLARLLARRLRRPVYVSCGSDFDRFSLPLVERGIITEIRDHPEYF